MVTAYKLTDGSTTTRFPMKLKLWTPHGPWWSTCRKLAL